MRKSSARTIGEARACCYPVSHGIAEAESDLVEWTLAAQTAQTALLPGAIRLF